MNYKMKKQQQGLSLLELMISLAIGLVLLLALASLMITANNSARQRSTSDLMDEQARQIFSRLENDLYRAGFVDSFMSDESLQRAFNSSDNLVMASYARQISNINDPDQISLMGRNSNGAILPLVGFDDANVPPVGLGMTCTNNRHCLQIAYQAIGNSLAVGGFSAVSTANQENASLSGASVGCNGIQATDTHPVLMNRYQIGIVGGENNTSLTCGSESMDFAGPSHVVRRDFQPIVAGVEQLVFRYLVTPADATPAGDTPNLDTTVSGRSVEKYLSASAVQAMPLGWGGVWCGDMCRNCCRAFGWRKRG